MTISTQASSTQAMHEDIQHESIQHFEDVDPTAREFYIHTLELLQHSGVPYLVGGGHALEHYTGVNRATHDLDIFVRPSDVSATLDALAKGGYETDLTFPHWLGKAHNGPDYVDIIFNAGNGTGPVDDEWFKHAVSTQMCGIAVNLVPVEETIWQKSLIQERERYDGADVAHLLHSHAESLDWKRLIARFGQNWRVLLSHLILFGFVYPGERNRVPATVVKMLLERLQAELSTAPPNDKTCCGTLLSREQYLIDITGWDYADGRLEAGYMKPEEIQRWTAAIENDHVQKNGSR